jgi:hypothetical protein
MNHHCGRYEKFTNRRDFLKKAGAGFGLLALADLLQGDGLLAGEIESSRTLDPMTPRQPHYPAKAKSIIWLFMEGAPSSVDLFDPKPELTKRDGQRIDIDVFNGNPGPLMKSPFSFKQYGQSGAWVCENIQRGETWMFALIDRSIANERSCPGALSDTGIYVRHDAGAWITYGPGSQTARYVVLGNKGVKGGPLSWSAGFLKPLSGHTFSFGRACILNLTRPEHVTREASPARFLKQAKTPPQEHS